MRRKNRVWRAEMILPSADGASTVEMMRLTGVQDLLMALAEALLLAKLRRK
jgi:hypothetical protein